MSKKNTQKKSTSKTLSPTPTSPEILRGLALAFDTQGLDRSVGNQIKEYVKKKQYIHETHTDLLRRGVVEPICIELTPKTQTIVEDAANRFFKMFHSSVLEFDWKHYERTEIINNFSLFISIIGMDVYFSLQEGLNLPSSKELVTDKGILFESLSWLEKNNTGWADAVTAFRDKNDENADYIPRWKAGASIPSFRSISAFSNCFPAKEQERTFILLLLARAVSSLCRTHEKLDNQLKYLHEVNPGSVDPVKAEMTIIDESESYHFFLHVIEEAHSLLEHSPHNPGVKKTISRYLIEARKLHKKERFSEASRWPLHLLLGRFHVANGKNKDALAEYQKAFKLSLYCAGEHQADIIEEALTVAAICKKTPFLKELKNQAITFKLLEENVKDEHDPGIAGGAERKKDDFVQDWEVRRWRQEFHQKFPIDSMFVDAEGDASDPESFIPIVDASKHVNPCLKHPNKVVQYATEGGRMRKPQILFFAMKNDFRSIKKLIQKNADFITPWKENGESVFHFALRWMSAKDLASPADDHLYRLLLPRIDEAANTSDNDCPIKLMVSTRFVKKRFSVLGSAVETCRPDVVAKVLEFGAAADQRHTMDQYTPLYGLCQLIDDRANLEKRDWALCQAMELRTHAQEVDIKRRYGIPSNAPLNSSTAMNLMRAAIRLEQEFLQKIDINDLLSIADILLANGADPNALHNINHARNRTPLMMAIESGNLELFELLLERGGDLSLQCFLEIDNKEYSCIDIAEKFRARTILEKMHQAHTRKIQ